MQSFNCIKYKISDYVVNNNLIDSYYYIQDSLEYSLSFWLRIISNDLNQTTAIIIELRNNQDQFIQLNLQDNNIITTTDENNSTQNQNWPAPIQTGNEDITNQAILYQKWLPIVFSKNQNNTLNIYSYKDLSLITYLNKNFNFDFSAFFNFNPQNTLSLEVIFDFIIFRDYAVQNASQIDKFYFDYGYLGMYSNTSRSKNGRIFLNQQKNSFEHNNLYMNEIYPLPFPEEGYFSNFQLHMPSFFDNRVFYICIFYLEQIYSFQNNYSQNQITSIKTNNLYKRIFNYQQIHFEFQLQFSYTFSNGQISANTNWIFNDSDAANIIGSMSINVGSAYINTKQRSQQIVFIKNYPNSSFQRQNTIQFIIPAYGNLLNKQYDVQYIYSYYDQIESNDNTTGNIKYILPIKILRIIYYRDLIQQTQLPSQGSADLYILIGYNKELQLQLVLDHNVNQYDINFNANQIYQIILGQNLTQTQENSYCNQAVPNCKACSDYQCINCKDQYYLVDGKCLLCNFDFMIYQNTCIQRSFYSNITNIQNFLILNQDYLDLIKIDIDYQNQGQIYNVTKNMFIENQQQIDILIQYLQNYIQIQKFRISKTYFSQIDIIKFQDFSICQFNQFMQLQNDFTFKCVDICDIKKHQNQNKLCVNNFEGCENQSQTQCNSCQQDFVQININNKIACLPTNLQNIKSVQEIYSTIKSSTSMQFCLKENSNNNCIKCQSNYILDQTSFNCKPITQQYQKLELLAVCTQYDNENSPTTCIGIYSNSYLFDQLSGVWTQQCQASINLDFTCDSCLQSNFYLNSLKTCIECLVYDQQLGQCQQCPSGYQLVQNQCFASNCQNITSNCLECQSQNLNVCAICNAGYILLSNGQNLDCFQEILNCITHVYKDGLVMCDQCSSQYYLIDQSYNIDIQGFKCISQLFFLENCNDYQLIQQEYKCMSCKQEYTFIQQYYCIPNQYFVQNCNYYDLQNNFCSSCQLNYVCLDNNITKTSNNCTQCIDQTLLISNCLKFSYDLQYCQQCTINFFCLNINFEIASNSCKNCIDQIYFVEGCQKYDSNLFNCIECQQNFICLDQNGFQVNTQCNQCLSQSQQIFDCSQYDVSTLLCQNCNSNFVCFDQNFYQGNTQCSYCQDSNLLVSNCNQYNVQWECTQCIDGYFPSFYSSSFICIQNSYFVDNCIEYNLDTSQNYFCIQCYNNISPINNVCTKQLYNQIYIKNQKIYIFQNNYIQNCSWYNYRQECIQCENDYQLVNVQMQNQVSIQCYQQIIENCQTYFDQSTCLKCLDNYIINTSLNLCILLDQCIQNQCLLDNNYQIHYGKAIQNCLIKIENCNICDLNNKNTCSICNQGYILKDQFCIFDCESNNDRTKQNYCNELQQQQINSLQYICEKIHNNCSQCKNIQNSLTCIKCKNNGILVNKNCYYNTLQHKELSCNNLCLSCDPNTECQYCPIGFQMKEGKCIIMKNYQEEIECTQNTLCYFQGSKQNKHCKQCKTQCVNHIKGSQIEISSDIQLYIKRSKQNIFCYVLSDSQKNKINIYIKDFYKSFEVQIESDYFFAKSTDCTPQNLEKFQIIQQINTKQDIAQQYIDKSYIVLPILVSISQNSPFSFLFFLLSDLRIFYFLDYIDTIYGYFGQKLQLIRMQNIQQAQQKLFDNFLSEDYFTQYIFIQQKVQAEFLNSLSIVQVYEIIFVCFAIGYHTLKLIIFFNPKQRTKYKRNIIKVIQQYLILKTIQVLIGFLSQVSVVHQIKTNLRTFKFTLITLTILVSYIWLILFYNIFREFNSLIQKEQMLLEKEEFRRKEKKLKLFVDILQITFLFVKFKLLFDIQKNSLLNQVMFILLNISDFIKIFFYKFFKYLKIIYICEMFYNFLLIIFCVLQILNQQFQIKINQVLLDVLLIMIISLIFLNNLIIETVFMLRLKKRKKIIQFRL